MNVNDLIFETKRLMMLRYPRFGGEIAAADIQMNEHLKYHTAATDGKNIYFDPNYFQSLSEDDRLFLIAHEIMHIKFEHAFRLVSRDGKKRDFDVWNEATDAIINANLERDGFTIKEGYVNRPEALKYSAEEFYEILMREKQEQAQQQQQKQNGEQGEKQDGQQSDGQQGEQQQSDEQQGQSGQENGKQQQHFGDDHSMWEKAFEDKMEQKSHGSKKQKSEQGSKQKSQFVENDIEDEESSPVDEKTEFQENREERKAKAKDYMDKLRDQELLRGEKISFGDVGESKPVVDWRLLLRREVEKTETIWSQRRSIAENNYAYRLEENDVEDEAETEVLIDVSGSVSLEMVKAFLRQLKPILKESKLKVGCFNERFWGMKEIKSVRDIDKFEIPQEARGHSAWTEDWDLAVRSFSKKREVNKIVFTDGCPCPGTMPKDDLKGTNVIWIVYENKSFAPCCGKVIQVDKSEFKQNAIKKEPERTL